MAMTDQPLTKDEKDRLLKSMEASLRTVAEPEPKIDRRRPPKRSLFPEDFRGYTR